MKFDCKKDVLQLQIPILMCTRNIWVEIPRKKKKREKIRNSSRCLPGMMLKRV